MSKKEFIDDLFKRRSDYKDSDQAEMACHMLSKLSTDIYSENKRFVFEFIQNADDSSINGSNEVFFDFLDDCLIVSHNGKAFSEDDIKSVTHAGSSTKTADATKTGYKGVGFKSVFGKSKRVSIFSDGYQFRFDRQFHSEILPWQVIPIWTENKDLPISAQRLLELLPYSVTTIIELPDTRGLENELKELLSDGEILLFLRHVSKITVRRNSKLQSEIIKSITGNNSAYQKVELRFDGRLVSTWLLKDFKQIPISENTKKALREDEDAPPKLKHSEYTDFSFAAKLVGEKIVPLTRKESLIFTYLPTKVRDYEFPFLVNASFLTNTPREALHEDQAWNKWLFQMVGKLLLRWFEDLARTSYCFQILNILPATGQSHITGLKRVFEDALRSGLPKCRFIVNSEGKINTLEKSIWDQTGLSEQKFINKKNIANYIAANRGISIDENAFIHADFESLAKLYSFGITTFELQELDLFFASAYFINNHKIEQNFDLICYFKRRSDTDAEGIWFHRLQTMPFIFNEFGVLANPSTGICFPTLPSSTELGEIPLIHKTVFDSIKKDNDIINWLKGLGVKEPSDIAYVTNVIIPSLEDPDFVGEGNHLQIISYLIRLFQDGQLTDEMLSQLRGLRIKTKKADNPFVRAHDCYLSDKYNPYTKLESTIPGLNYVSDEYLAIMPGEHKISAFLKAICVKDRIEIETIDWLKIPEVCSITSEEWVDQAREEARRSGGYGFGNYNLIRSIKLPSFLHLLDKNYLFAEIFWQSILSSKDSLPELSSKAFFVYGTGNGANRYSQRIENYFKWFIQYNNCIPASTEELVNPKQVFAYTKEVKQLAGKHLPIFTYENPLSDDWKKFLGFKDGLELEHYLFILESISLNAQDGEQITKAEIKRIGLLYEKIATLLPEYAEDKREMIKEWADNHKVLSGDHTFEYPSELMFINIPGFIGADSLNLIHFPVNSDFNEGNYGELLDLFSVKVINTFVPKYQAAQEDYSLKNLLLLILPYFAKLVEIREGTSFSSEFSRMFEILSSLNIMKAQKINLAFLHRDKEFFGPDLPTYQSGTDFCYVGKFASPITKFSVVPQLYKLFGVNGLIDEFRLLLDISEDDIKEWFLSMGIDANEIGRSSEYQLTKSPFKPVMPIQSISPKASNQKKATKNLNEETTPAHVSEYLSQKPREGFVPDVKAAEASFSKASFYKPSEVHSITEYSVNLSDDIDHQSKVDIGRWSEEYVFSYLQGKYKNVNWLNENGESYRPYDFIVTTDQDVEIFIEVKGTASNSKSIFPISIDEWKLMFQKGANYFIYRVFSAGTDEPRLIMIENPAKEILNGTILPNPMHLQI